MDAKLVTAYNNQWQVHAPFTLLFIEP